jgi:membrane protease subunit HflC
MIRLIGIFTFLLLVFGVLFLSGSFFVVQETQYCIVTNYGGSISKVYTQPGLNFLIPFAQKAHYYPNRARTLDAASENIVTGDQKKLMVDSYVQWKIEDPTLFRNRIAANAAQDVFIKIATDRISIITHNALKDVLGRVQLSDIIATSRVDIASEALKNANIEAAKLGIKLVDIRIKKVELPKVNESKTYEKMQAVRYKEADYYRSRGHEEAFSIKAQADKDVSIIEAEAIKKSEAIRAAAEGTTIEIYGTAHKTDPTFYGFYRSLQALKKTVDTNTTLVISPKSELFKYLDGN